MEERKKVILTGFGALLLYLVIVLGVAALVSWFIFPLISLEVSFENVIRLSIIVICIHILKYGLKARCKGG